MDGRDRDDGLGWGWGRIGFHSQTVMVTIDGMHNCSYVSNRCTVSHYLLVKILGASEIGEPTPLLELSSAVTWRHDAGAGQWIGSLLQEKSPNVGT